MFHVVYSRHYWDVDHQDGDSMFSNTWTLYRNVSYSQIGDMQGKILIMKAKADKAYAKAEKKRRQQEDPEQFEKSEVYIVDDKDYFRTYKDEHPDVLSDSYYAKGLVPKEEDYYNDYGQKCQFLLIKDFDETYTWFGKDWTQDMVEAEYKRRENVSELNYA